MNKEDFVKQYAVERQNTNSVKWDGMQAKFGENDLLPMWVADMEFKTPEAVREALHARIDEGAFGYSFTPDTYYDAYFTWQKERYGIELHKEWVRFNPNVVQSLSNLVQLLTKPGDAVMVLQPVYFPFMDVIEKNGRKLVVSNLIDNHGHYELDLDDMRQKMIDNQVRLMIFCNPHNPVGRVWSAQELEDVLELCRQEQVLVISDEIHHDLMIDGSQFTSMLNIRDGFYRDNLVVVDSPSKTFNLASLWNSHVIIPNPQIMMRYDAYQERMKNPGGCLLGQVAGEAAYRHGTEWLEGLLETIADNYHYVRDELKKELPEAVISPLEGTYLAWIDLSQLVAAEDLQTVIQDKAKLAVDFGDWFGEAGKGHIRFNLATTPANVRQATKQLIQAVRAYQE